MRNLVRTPFAAIFRAEVLLNSKRVAPYAMAILFGANALLWWGWGPATGRGWATNSEFFISGVLPVYSFMTLPLFTALIMADPVIRDFRTGIYPLIFSKPVSRAEYLLGKFFGNFFVLVCCQAAFVFTLFVLQAFRKPGMIVQDVRVFPYLKHFLVFVAISHLVLAAFYFTVGTLTRSAKIVYGLGVSFYPLYITYQTVLLKSLPSRWRIALDPLLMNWGKGHANAYTASAQWLNQLVIAYDSDLIVNRAFMLLIAALCLATVYFRFATTERSLKAEKFSLLNLSAGSQGFYYDPPSIEPTLGDRYEKPSHEKVLLPEVTTATDGLRTNLNKLIAALVVEFRLLLSERSLVVIMPLAVFLSTLEVAFWNVTPEPSFSAAYAGNTAKSLLLFLLGINTFYTGEAMHRDRDLRMEPLLWSQAAPNYVLLLSKLLATLVLTITLILIVALITLTLQGVKHNGPIELVAYLRVYGLILIPNAIFLAGTALALSVLLRDRYLTYAAAIGTCVGLFYLYTRGHNHWLYNPLLFQLWDYPDLVGGRNYSRILWHRIYILSLASLFLRLAHLCYPRNSKTTSRVR
jgi:ABC-2 type transport system permease protein